MRGGLTSRAPYYNRMRPDMTEYNCVLLSVFQTINTNIVSITRKWVMKKVWLIALSLISCEHDDIKEIAPINYIVFGHFYGECFGEQCVELYKLTDTALYEDTADRFSNCTDYKGNFKLLDDALFQKVKALAQKIPQDLIVTNQQTIGQPDAGDWGGLYFEIRNEGMCQFWLIDKMKTNLPEWLIPLAVEIERDIELINN